MELSMPISKLLNAVAIAFLLISSMTLLISSMTASAADVRGDQFITEMDGNTLSGTNASGLAFNLYFLAGGQVTYTNVAGARVNGTWHLDQNGDVCIQWPRPVDAMAGCFRMSIDGDTVIWRSAKASGRGVLRGNVADSFLKRQQ
jgi:hypothetical protein